VSCVRKNYSYGRGPTSDRFALSCVLTCIESNGSRAASAVIARLHRANFGWQTINAVIFPTIFVADALLVWLAVRKQAAV
jgi:hypothetical protein